MTANDRLSDTTTVKISPKLAGAHAAIERDGAPSGPKNEERGAARATHKTLARNCRPFRRCAEARLSNRQVLAG